MDQIKAVIDECRMKAMASRALVSTVDTHKRLHDGASASASEPAEKKERREVEVILIALGDDAKTAREKEHEAIQCVMCNEPCVTRSICINGHLGCLGCVRGLMASTLPSRNKCPTCRTALLPKMPQFRPYLVQLRMCRYATYLPGACNAFISVDPVKAAAHEDVCEFRTVTCAHAGCGKAMFARDAVLHEGTCALRLCKCPFCPARVLRSSLFGHMSDAHSAPPIPYRQTATARNPATDSTLMGETYAQLVQLGPDATVFACITGETKACIDGNAKGGVMVFRAKLYRPDVVTNDGITALPNSAVFSIWFEGKWNIRLHVFLCEHATVSTVEMRTVLSIPSDAPIKMRTNLTGVDELCLRPAAGAAAP